jgi:hypothetical protein
MMSARGEGIGLELTTSVVRGVRLSADEPGRVVAACEVPIHRFDDNAVVFDALVRARGRLGDGSLTTRVGWFPTGASLQRLDATGLAGPELNEVRHRLAAEVGITSTMLVDDGPRRWMMALRWDHARAWWLQEMLERSGFVDVTVEPSPLAIARVLSPSTTVVRRDASAERSWAAISDGIPVAAASIDTAGREHPTIATSDVDLGVHDLDRMMPEAELVQEVARLVAEATSAAVRTSELDAQLLLLDEPYPPFPGHDLRAPQRIGVALGAALGAAGLAGRLREVDVLSSVRPQGTDLLPRPWAVERLHDAPLEIERQRPGWWSRTAKLVRGRYQAGSREI